MGLYQWVPYGVNLRLASDWFLADERSRQVNMQRAIDNISRIFGRPVIGIHNERYSTTIYASIVY